MGRPRRSLSRARERARGPRIAARPPARRLSFRAPAASAGKCILKEAPVSSATRAALAATFQRELTAHRLHRFLLVHLAIAATAGFLPLFTPTELTSAAPWWLLQAVLYALSLSALLLGLSSAHGEADEFPMLFTQPVSRSAWMLGKAAGLAAVLVPAALLLVAPVALAGGLTSSLTAVAVAAAGVTLALAAIGLALGFWVRDR